MFACYLYARKHGIDEGHGRIIVSEVWRTFKGAFFALIAPVIIIGGVTTGFFTATESGIIACLYALFCGFFIYRTLQLRDLPNIFRRATATSAMLLMIMGSASIYSFIFARARVVFVIEGWLLSISQDPMVITLLILGIMLVIGTVMETIAVMVVFLPLVYPIIINLGVDPLMFGVAFCISTAIGGLTPPVGLYLFLSMHLTQANFKEAAVSIMLPVAIVTGMMLLILIVPSIVTFLPNLLMG
jgi:C4-dicarboxylate transporter DctM subunit